MDENFLLDTDFQHSQPLTPQVTVLQLMSCQEAIMRCKYDLQLSLSLTFNSDEGDVICHTINQLQEEWDRTRIQVKQAVVNLALGANVPHLPQDHEPHQDHALRQNNIPHQDHGLGDALLWGDDKKHILESTEENVHAPVDHTEEVEALSSQILALVITMNELRKTLKMNSKALMKSEDSFLRETVTMTEENLKNIKKEINCLKRRKKKLANLNATLSLPVKNESKIAIPAPQPSKRKRVQGPPALGYADGGAATDSPATHATSSAATTEPAGNLPGASGKKSTPAPTRPPETVMNMEVEEQDHSDADSLAYFKYNEVEKAEFEGESIYLMSFVRLQNLSNVFQLRLV